MFSSDSDFGLRTGSLDLPCHRSDAVRDSGRVLKDILDGLIDGMDFFGSAAGFLNYELGGYL